MPWYDTRSGYCRYPGCVRNTTDSTVIEGDRLSESLFGLYICADDSDIRVRSSVSSDPAPNSATYGGLISFI